MSQREENEQSADFDVLADQDAWVPCPHCGGSGIELEGWDCDYCDGTGELEL